MAEAESPKYNTSSVGGSSPSAREEGGAETEGATS
jgi:hypothetical protein